MTNADERIRLYEQEAILDVAGETIRPGGLALTERAFAACALPAGARVLDVGCGPAASIQHLNERYAFSVLGIDPSLKLLWAARAYGRLPLLQAVGEHLPLAARQVDAVLAECSLSLMKDKERALAEFYRVLRPGGWLILSDIYARNPGDLEARPPLPVASCLGGALPQAEVIHRVQEHGFTIQVWEDHTAALKSFVAQLIWKHGSIRQFWSCAASPAQAGAVQAAVAQTKPGYYLLIAQKESF